MAATRLTTGVALTISRRLSLLEWAATCGAWIIEDDDYDGEFHYRGRPLPALKSLDTADRVLYVGSFSKVLFPGLRMGYVVVPRELAESFNAGCILLQPAAAMVEQAVVGEFIAQGYFARHIRKMRQLYAERRSTLMDAIERQCADRLEIDLQAGGLHLLAYLRGRPHIAALQKRAAALRVAFFPVSRTRLESSGKPGLLLGFTNIPASEADRAAERLRNVLSVP